MSIDTSKLDNSVRVRFPPSPTGDPHVGMVRSALFNYAFARHYGGTLVLRIEDTDAARNTEASYQAILDTLRWAGIEWDEGPEVGGEYGPYRQSERGEIYADVAARLAEGGYTYNCYCTAEELEAAREKAKAEKRAPGYEGTCRNLTAEQIAAYEAEGRTHVVRFRMPQDRTIVWDDMVRGEISFESRHVPDYPLLRADGSPLYTLVNPVDDAMMGITHVFRGEDLLSSTPRQIPLHEALVELGVSKQIPRFGHLPFVMGEGNKKLSKRDPEASFSYYPRTGYLPEGLVNYVALLGWSLGGDEEIFSKDELVAAFDGTRISVNPARFDLKKCEAINAVHLRRLETVDLAKRILPYLDREGLLRGREGHLADEEEWRTLLAAVPLVQERMTVLSEAVGMLGFLYTGDGTDERHAFQVDEADAAKVLTADAWPTLAAAASALEALPEWTTPAIEEALRTALVEGLGLKPKNAFTPVRVAVTGRRVSPPLFESIELLGRERTLARLRDADAKARAAASAG
ncbi:MAG TPA: glutamate--tRNA ligase [Actinospica sp.]|nr:glutamate--tRNA ligase [Actinospica sp.]